MSKVGSVLIVGANRGLGLQLVKDVFTQLKPKKIFATYRTPDRSKELLELAKANSVIRPIQLDAADDSKFADVVKLVDLETKEAGLNLLVFNAAINTGRPQTIETTTGPELLEHFRVNTIAPFLLEKAFLPLLVKASRSTKSGPAMGIHRAAIVNISSIMGSIGLWDVTGARRGGAYAYRSSKAALNMITRSLSGDLKNDKILAVVIHPGWVKTDMGGDEAPLTVEQSAGSIVTLLATLNETHNGQFYQYDGQQLTW